MCDEWMPTLRLPLTPEQFRELPRNSAYRYDYVDGCAVLSPQGRYYHALLELRPGDESAPVPVRPVEVADLPNLATLFAAAFAFQQPFGSLDDATRLQAARACLDRTRAGGDGPWVQPASFVALAEDGVSPIGAIFITLLPKGDPCQRDSYYWIEQPPPDCLERRLGQAHLTWVFVSPLRSGQGVGTALLAAAGQQLLALGYTQLASTFLAGNDSSMLWHWRNGFQLLAHPGSRRLRPVGNG
jgi:GNAT superfamily N-acetyltransferase